MDAVYGDDELAVLYDLDYATHDQDLLMYEQFAARGELPSLEICVGTGRVALHLARAGHDVVGLDASAAMLARCEAKLDPDTSARVRLVEGDMRSFDLAEKFDLVYIALNSFEHNLTSDDATAALRYVATHLAPGGVFVLELHTLRSIDWSQHRSGALQLEWTRPDPDTGDLVSKLAATRVSQTTQTATHAIMFDRYPMAGGPLRRRGFDVTLRIYGLFEFEALLERAGLRVAQVYGAADLSPLGDDDDTMVVVAEHAT
jgi:SAM-dependent methyltransferase